MTDVGGGLGLVTSSSSPTTTTAATHTHSSHMQSQTQTQNKWQQKNQTHTQTHSLRDTSTRRSTSASLSTSTSKSTTTKPATTTTTTKGRITRSAAAAAAVAAAAVSSKAGEASEARKAAGDKEKDEEKAGPPPRQKKPSNNNSNDKMSSTMTTTGGLTNTANAATSSSSSNSSSPLTRKRAATLITTDLALPTPSPQKQRLTIDPGAARSGGTKVEQHPAPASASAPAPAPRSAAAAAGGSGGDAKEPGGSGSASPQGTGTRAGAGAGGAGSATTELDNYSAGSSVGGSVGGGGGGQAGQGGYGGGGGGGGGVQRDLICLCTPAPKVPRPRNAFILYRQHHQARVVADHPGLANPEISKIIGEKWRAESDLHKEEWKQLAEEEKLHHQRKYPEYKYQPRRGNKHTSTSSIVVGVGAGGGTGSNRGSPTTPGGPGGIGGIGGSGGIGGGGGQEHPGRCPNCGGRYIATPRTPSTPFTAGSAKSVMHGGEGRTSGGGGQSGMDTPRGSIEHASSSSARGQHYGQQHGGGYYRDHHRASVSSQGGGYQAYPSRDYHHSQTYHYPTASHHQPYPAHPLYDMPQEYDVATPTGTSSSSKRRRYDSTSMPYRPEREYALPSPTTLYGSSSRHPSVGGQYAVRPPSHYHQQNPMSPTPLGLGHSYGHGQVPLHIYPAPPPPTPSGTIGSGGGGGGTGSLPPTPGFAPAPAGPPTSTAALSGPASIAPSGRGRSPLSNTMAPPPRPPKLSVPGSSGSYHHGQQHSASGRSRSGLSPLRTRGDESVFDPSLRLPPLQTHLAHLPPTSPESGSGSSGTGAGPGIISAAGGGGGIGLGITYPSDPRDPRSATSSSPYPRLTGHGTAGNTPTAGSFPASYHQGAQPHPTLQQPPTSVHPSWATLHHQGQKEQQQVARGDPSPVAAVRDNIREPTTATTQHYSHSSDPNTTNSSTNSKRQLALLEAQQRQQSVEAMVMSIDYVRKASVLRWIGRELPAYGAVADNIDNMSETGDDTQEQQQIVTTRGPIIAVEGPNKELLRVVGKAVERALIELGDCEVRAWVGEGDVWHSDEAREKGTTSEKEKENKGGGDVEMGDTVIVRGSSPKSNNNGQDRVSSHSPPSGIVTPIPSTNPNPFPRYLDLMLSWHLKASELTKFVTTPYFSPSSSSSSYPSRFSSPSHSPSSTSQNLPKLPIALLPLGYSLTYSDRFACTIPIADAYAPVDHWQWMATLWRGIVGPDLTVYVKPVTEENTAVEGWAPVGVEVKGERLIVVRVVVPSGWGGQKEAVAELGSEAEKQLAYEVGEWVRAGAFGVQGRGGVARGERERDLVPQGGYEYGRGHGYGGEGW
ncbi:hypothetical protein NEUTE2DRAFT_91123 [Neurospora tetrasperma FGSC 2509]|nr:hypothetical protein NEUTE2DRAFT_91123 [Neurospora tetrasperma FGSC 2509]